MPQLNKIALTTLSHEQTMTYTATKVERRTKRVRHLKRKEKKPVKRQTCSSSMTCIYMYPCSWPWEKGMNMLLSCGLLVYVSYDALHHVFSLKESSSTLLVSALYQSQALDQYWWVRFAGAGASPPPCFFSAVFSEWQIVALCFLFV